MYYRCLDDGSFIYLLLYVDDMLIASKILGTIDVGIKFQKQEMFNLDNRVAGFVDSDYAEDLDK